MNNIRRIPWVAIVILAWTLGCTPYRQSNDIHSSNFFSSGDPDLVPKTDQLVGDCHNSKDHDVCLFMKNPVFQEGTVVSAENLEANRRFGVKLRGLTVSGFLENSRVRVLTAETPRFSLQFPQFLRAPFSDDRSYAEQVSAYYYSNRVFDYLVPRLGQNRVPAKGIKIYADDAFTGYSASKNSIHLEKVKNKIPHAFHADVVTQLVGQAMASALSKNAVFTGSREAQHKICDLNPYGCCVSEMGCSQALASSFGDYLAGVMSPQAPRLGESVSGSVDGQNICGVRRDLSTLSSLTRTQVFAQCTDSQGKAVLLGAWYASLWWKIRQQAEGETVGESREIDILFFDHARDWTGTSTFSEAKTKALELATTHRNGKFLDLFNSVFNSAGL